MRDYSRPAYRWYTTGLLMLIYACHALDRGLPNILIEPVRHEFGLTDAELGLFSGLAFGLAFAAAGIPLGIISDRVNRRNLLAGAVIVWSAFTALGGLARSYVQLVLTRVGVGAAEASAAPIAMPLITDIFPARQRAFALGVFYMSPALGAFLASVVGAYVAVAYGWRAAFFVAGIPGLLLALLLLSTVSEPRRGSSEAASGGAADDDAPAPPLKEVAAFLFKSPRVLCLIAGSSLIGLNSITFGAWAGSFFIRIHGVELTTAGLILGTAGFVGVGGPPLYGWIADRLSLANPRWALRLVWVSGLVVMLLGFAMLFSPSLAVAVVCFVLLDFLRHGYPPPTYSVLMSNTPVRMRGTIMSVLQFTTNLVGFGLGPVLAGWLSDLYGGEDGIRYALANVMLLFLVITPLYMVANRGFYGQPQRGRPPAAAA